MTIEYLAQDRQGPLCGACSMMDIRISLKIECTVVFYYVLTAVNLRISIISIADIIENEVQGIEYRVIQHIQGILTKLRILGLS